MNAESSRSHSLLIVSVVQKDSVTERVIRDRLVLGGLAGSERVKKTQVSGRGLEEAKNINRSLSTLGMVINSLTDGSSHVPYRDSKLTRVLQDSLGGNSRTALIVCCAPERQHTPETVSTLRFGERASRIRNVIVRNEELSVPELKKLVEEGNAEIARLEKLVAGMVTEEGRLRDLVAAGRGGTTDGGGHPSAPPAAGGNKARANSSFDMGDEELAAFLLGEIDGMGITGEGHDLLHSEGFVVGGVEEFQGPLNRKGEGGETENSDDLEKVNVQVCRLKEWVKREHTNNQSLKAALEDKEAAMKLLLESVKADTLATSTALFPDPASVPFPVPVPVAKAHGDSDDSDSDDSGSDDSGETPPPSAFSSSEAEASEKALLETVKELEGTNDALEAENSALQETLLAMAEEHVLTAKHSDDTDDTDDRAKGGGEEPNSAEEEKEEEEEEGEEEEGGDYLEHSAVRLVEERPCYSGTHGEVPPPPPPAENGGEDEDADDPTFKRINSAEHCTSSPLVGKLRDIAPPPRLELDPAAATTTITTPEPTGDARGGGDFSINSNMPDTEYRLAELDHLRREVHEREHIAEALQVVVEGLRVEKDEALRVGAEAARAGEILADQARETAAAAAVAAAAAAKAKAAAEAALAAGAAEMFEIPNDPPPLTVLS